MVADDVVSAPVVAPNLGLAYVAASLEKNNIPVDLLDANSLQSTLPEILDKVREFNPTIIGLGCITPTAKICVELTKKLKEAFPNIKIVIGGVHAYFKADELIKEKTIDFVIRGEGEYVFPQLVNALDKKMPLGGVKGLVYKSGGKVFDNGFADRIMDLDQLPFPARHLLPNKLYSSPGLIKVGGKPFGSMITSRGCPFSCNYCASAELWKRKVTFHSADYVLKELDQMVETLKIKYLHFYDDTFSVRPDRVMDICNGMIDKNYNLKWAIELRVKGVDEKMLEKLKEAGCVGLYFGIEFGSQRILDLTEKGITIEDIKKMMALVDKVGGFNVQGFFMMGYPTETKEEIMQSIELAKSLNFHSIGFSIVTPFPGTHLYDYCEKNNLLVSKDWNKYNLKVPRMLIKNSNYTEEELKALFSKGYHDFYTRPSYIAKMLASIRTLNEAKYYFSQGMRMIK